MPTDRVFLTGGSGFVGSHVLRQLLDAGYPVRALSRSSSLDGRCELVAGDMRRPGELLHALEDCRYLIHCAALYSFAPSDRKRVHEVNVKGTAGLLEAAHIAGIERAVVTSSSATLGASEDGRAKTEADFSMQQRHGGYHDSKIDQERAAFASRVPVVVLLPTAPVGPGDRKPTPTGELILNFARGRIFAKPPRGGMNLVAVEDVARAHVEALERGKTGERYILGGENLTLDALWSMLAEIAGNPLPRARVPGRVAVALAHLDELRCTVARDAKPIIPLEGARMANHLMFADSSKAKAELGFSPGSVRDALERAVAWYRASGYCN